MDDLRIIDYMNDWLSEAERAAFEKELQTNAVLAERYAYLKSVAAATKLNSVRTSINKTEQDLDREGFFEKPIPADAPESKSATSSKRIFLFAAAALMLLLLFGLIRINKNCSDQAIAQSSMKGEKINSNVTRNAGAAKNIYQIAIQHFYSGDLTKATAAFAQVPSTHPNYNESRYAMGLIYFKEGDYNQAINLVKPLNAETGYLRDKSAWLQLNAQICENGFTDTLVTQFIATNPEDFYLKKAQNLLKSAAHPFRALVF